MQQFDPAASDYDEVFTNSCVGKAQRSQVWKYVDRWVTPNATSVLEMNCGTGHDANIWKERNKEILATDISGKMIAVAMEKYPKINFQTLDLREISSVSGQFDTIFSNFGGLNCLSHSDLEQFFADAARLLQSGNRIAIVIMGKKCLWDQLYMIAKRRWKDRSRRNTNEALLVNVDGEAVPTWYYTPDEIKQLAEAQFNYVAQRPVGLFVPPSYLAPAFEKRPILFGVAKWLDSIFTHPGLSNSADHFILILERK